MVKMSKVSNLVCISKTRVGLSQLDRKDTIVYHNPDRHLPISDR